MGVASKINFGSVDSLFGTEDSTVNIKISELHTFKNHPFKVVDDEKMDDLVASIKERGVLNPITVRPCDNGYEIISGHRRTHACKLAGIDEIPAIVKDLTDDEATIEMVDYNIQREELLPSEKAFAYKMKFDALNHQGIKGSKTNEEIGKELGDSGRQVQRYIRLTNLIPDLIEYVDIKKLPLNVGVELSYLKESQQQMIVDYMAMCQVYPSIAQAKELRKYSESDDLTEDNILMVLQESTKDTTSSVKISSATKSLFPKSYSNKDITELIERLVVNYFHNK